MKYLIVYKHEFGYGNCVCNFLHDPPSCSDLNKTLADLNKTVEDLTGSTKSKCVLLNYMKLSEDDDEAEEQK